ncbi:MAG: hypothetical protein V1661_00525 [bacterium]
MEAKESKLILLQNHTREYFFDLICDMSENGWELDVSNEDLKNIGKKGVLTAAYYLWEKAQKERVVRFVKSKES